MGTTKHPPIHPTMPDPERLLHDFVSLVNSISPAGKQGPAPSGADAWSVIYSNSDSSNLWSNGVRYTVRQGRGKQASLFAVEARFTGVSKQAVFELLARPGNRHLWDTSCEVGETIERIDTASSSAAACECFVEYYRLAGAWPVIKQREMVLLTVNATLLSHPQPSTNKIRTYSVSTSTTHASRSSKRGYQRFHLTVGGFVVEDGEDEESVIFTQICDVGDLIKWTPAYVVKTCTSILVARSLAKIQEQARLLNARRQVFDSPLFSCPVDGAPDNPKKGVNEITKPDSSAREEQEEQVSAGEITMQREDSIPDAYAAIALGFACQSGDQTATDDGIQSIVPRDSVCDNGNGPMCYGQPSASLAPDVLESDQEEVGKKTSEARLRDTDKTPSSSSMSDTSSLLSLAAQSPGSDQTPASADTSASSTSEDLSFDSSESQSRMYIESTLRRRQSDAAKRLSYFGDLADGAEEGLASPLLRAVYPLLSARDDDSEEQQERLEELLPRVLARDSGLAAAHRLSKALSVLELREVESAARRRPTEQQAFLVDSRTCSVIESCSEDTADTTSTLDDSMQSGINKTTRPSSIDSLQAIMEEIADAAQPFFTPGQFAEHKVLAMPSRPHPGEVLRQTNDAGRRKGSWMASVSWWFGY